MRLPVALDQRFAAGGACRDAAFPIMHIAEIDVLEPIGQGDVAGLFQAGRRGLADVVQLVGRRKALRTISRSFFGLPEASISMPRMAALSRISGLRPHHLPSRQRLPEVGLALLVGSGRETSKGNWVSMKAGISVIGVVMAWAGATTRIRLQAGGGLGYPRSSNQFSRDNPAAW